MDQPEPPAPAPEGDTVKYDNEEDEGEQFDFDSGDEIPEADRQAAGADAASGSGDVGTGADTDAPAEPTAREVPTRASPYSVIDIAPFQEEQCPPADPGPEDGGLSLPVPSGYSVPVPCGYAVPCNLPLLLPAYSSPVVTHAASLHGEETQEVTEDGQFNSLSSEDPMNSDDRVHKEDSVLARWVADPANTAWMESRYRTPPGTWRGHPGILAGHRVDAAPGLQCQESSPDRVTLYSLMMKPIQRFPQFILLLQDMLKNTSKGHPDRLPLQMALTELETLAEKLNERKRDADQRCEIKHVAKAINERYLNKLLSSGNRYLVRSDDMIETVYNDRGEIIKTKERRIFMLSDVLMCATVSARTSDSNTLMSASQRYLLKWSVPLGHVEVIEYSKNDGAGENRCPPVHPPESLAVVANAKPNQVYVGPGQLYQDLQNLLHDLNIVGQISQLIGNLRGNYQNLNQSVAHDWTSGLQRLILKKEEDIRAADCCRIQLQLPGKQDKSGRPTFFTAVFNTFTPAIKESWINNLQMAKLALEEENHMGWFCVEDDGNQIKKERHPLLVGHMPVTVAKQQEFKVMGGTWRW
ncbi:rho guanine nucleotide exchange factor 10-like, partial [Leptonychotes weddellii]|uniref:Rho guanine nucleotide exchange factor 10-like n=1 Tax=Leptonychotes weddellii TaxID=9713 RepID=A0A2U3YZC1_LEPWE